MHRMRHFEALEPRLALDRVVEPEAAQLGFGARLARAELDPAARNEVQRRHPFGRRGRVVVGRRASG